MSQSFDIIERIEELGVDYPRLHSALESKEPWGKLVHSFEYLTVLGVVEDAMRLRHEKLDSQSPSD